MKKKILFLDTETSGFYRKPSDNPKKDPWIVEIAILVQEIDTEDIIESEPIEILHGISVTKATHDGIFEKDIAAKVDTLLEDVDALCCHNTDFDFKFLFDLLVRHNKGGALYKLSTIPHICTMKATTDFCQLPHKSPYGKKSQAFKWPKLTELYEILFKESFPNAHCAYDDTKATIKCFVEVVKREIIKLEDIFEEPTQVERN
jgi:DNA polymerase-3 subunit alpha